MTVNVGSLKLVIAIVVLVVALVLAVMGSMPWLTAGLFMALAVACILG